MSGGKVRAFNFLELWSSQILNYRIFLSSNNFCNTTVKHGLLSERSLFKLRPSCFRVATANNAAFSEN